MLIDYGGSTVAKMAARCDQAVHAKDAISRYGDLVKCVAIPIGNGRKEELSCGKVYDKLSRAANAQGVV